MPYRPLRTLVSLVALGLAAAAPVAAQDPARECAAAPRPATPSPDQVRERAARIKELRAMLGDLDPNLRMAAFDEMVRACDVAMQEVAFEAAFTSAELSLRSLALRQRLVRLPGLTLEVAYPPGAKDREGKPPPLNGRYTLTFNHRDEATGTVGISMRAYGNTPDPKEMKDVAGTVKAVGLELVIDATRLPAGWAHCSGRLRLGQAGQLAGSMSCYNLPDLVVTGRLL